MKSFIVFAVCLAVALAAPADQDAVVLRNDQNNIGVGGYDFGYETSNGIAAAAQAVVEEVVLEDGTRTEGLVVRGQYQYTAPNGVTYNVQYIADKDGFRPIGEHIPV